MGLVKLKLLIRHLPSFVSFLRSCHRLPLSPSLKLGTAHLSAGVGDLSFEAESPLAPPAELLERLPSYDCLFQGGGKSAGSWLLWPLPGASAGRGVISGIGQHWDRSLLLWEF